MKSIIFYTCIFWVVSFPKELNARLPFFFLVSNNTDTTVTHEKDSVYFTHQKDLIDLVYKVLHKNPASRIDSSGINNTNLYFSIAPIVEFTIATGFSPGVAGNVAFKTSVKQQTNTSSFLGGIKYTEKKQFLFPVQSSVWLPGNKYILLGDWRYLDYPQDTYGFGAHTTENDKYTVTFKYLRFYEWVFRKIKKNLYFGAGYQLDYHWGIAELDLQPGRLTDFQKYGYSKSSISSGLSLNILYDSRENAINPQAGNMFANLHFRQNAGFLGSNSSWSSLTFDIRRYFRMPFHTLLAMWCYSVINLSGTPPYLDLPGTGSDTYNNTGRGYEQSRFIGKNMIDLEAELRFNITKNGLLGGVIFGNAGSVTELGGSKLNTILPAIGLGLRIKFNKFSGTNICIDYGIGSKGSRGFVGNLGEIF